VSVSGHYVMKCSCCVLVALQVAIKIIDKSQLSESSLLKVCQFWLGIWLLILFLILTNFVICSMYLAEGTAAALSSCSRELCMRSFSVLLFSQLSSMTSADCHQRCLFAWNVFSVQQLYSARLQNNDIWPKMSLFCCFWSDPVELPLMVSSWPITDTDSVLCAFEDYLPTYLRQPQPSPTTDHPIASIFHTHPQRLDALKSGILLQGVQEGSSMSSSSSIPMRWFPHYYLASW